MNLICGLSNSNALTKSIAGLSKSKYSNILISKFPDGESYLRFPRDVKGKNVFLVSSLYPNPNKSLMELILAYKTAKNLKAKKVHLLIPYLAYMRQDKRFKPGESISSKIMAELLSSADSLTTLDPHLHRIKSLNQIFKTKTKVLHAAGLLSKPIKERFKDYLLIGPDIESHQWVSQIAKQTGNEFIVLRKTRFSSRKVKIKFPKYDFKNKKVLVIDDMVTSGHTIIETARLLKKKGVSKVALACVHGIFAENALTKLQKAGINPIVCTNSVQSSKSKIDIAPLFSGLIRK